jgi:organic radical activating enzyme
MEKQSGKKKQYSINEVFYSIQGEGVHAGRAAIFVRFAGCNLKCTFCDTDHAERVRMTAKELIAAMKTANDDCHQVVLTGGEPALQLDVDLVRALHAEGYWLQIETNGTKALPVNLGRGSAAYRDHVTVSPKFGGMIVLKKCDELKIVVDVPDIKAIADRKDLPRSTYQCVSPVFNGGKVDDEMHNACVNWVLTHPEWQLAFQLHKVWGVR